MLYWKKKNKTTHTQQQKTLMHTQNQKQKQKKSYYVFITKSILTKMEDLRHLAL